MSTGKPLPYKLESCTRCADMEQQLAQAQARVMELENGWNAEARLGNEEGERLLDQVTELTAQLAQAQERIQQDQGLVGKINELTQQFSRRLKRILRTGAASSRTTKGDTMTFKFAIGEAVARKETVDCALHEMRVLSEIKRVDSMTVIERHSVECVAGTQLFYACETWQGFKAVFAEDSLMPMQECWDRWGDMLREVLQAQDERKASLDKRDGGI